MKHEMEREDFQSGAWSRLTKTLQARLQELRELNDAHRDIAGTAEIRGQIKAVKDILDLSKDSSRLSEQPGYHAAHLAELSELGVDP